MVFTHASKLQPRFQITTPESNITNSGSSTLGFGAPICWQQRLRSHSAAMTHVEP
jgi:hypothetical protein